MLRLRLAFVLSATFILLVLLVLATRVRAQDEASRKTVPATSQASRNLPKQGIGPAAAD